MAREYGIDWKTARSWQRRERGQCIECANESASRLCKVCWNKWYPSWKKSRNKRLGYQTRTP